MRNLRTENKVLHLHIFGVFYVNENFAYFNKNIIIFKPKPNFTAFQNGGKTQAKPNFSAQYIYNLPHLRNFSGNSQGVLGNQHSGARVRGGVTLALFCSLHLASKAGLTEFFIYILCMFVM